MSEKEELKEGLSTYINMMETEKGEKIEKITIENDIKYMFSTKEGGCLCNLRQPPKINYINDLQKVSSEILAAQR